jgi:excisionase family DNA binding protein
VLSVKKDSVPFLQEATELLFSPFGEREFNLGVTKMNSLGKMYSVKEVAGMLGVGRDTVMRLIRRGRLKAVKLPICGGRGKNVTYRVSEGDIGDFLRACRV